MKKVISLIVVLLIALTAVAVSLVTCDEKSQNSRLALKAMDSGDYERAKRLYNFAIERGEADGEDERIYEIISAYIDASRCLKSEDFTEGLDILDACKYDYSKLSICNDMDKLYSQLSEGKYADERIKVLTGAVNAQEYERAKTLVEEIGKLSLTSAQQDRLYALSRAVTGDLSQENVSIIYYVNCGSSSDIPMYFEADDDSDELCRISGGEAVEVKSFAEDGFIEIYYDGFTGYVKGSLLSPEKPESEKNVRDDKDDTEDADDKNDKSENEQAVDEDKNKDNADVPVEAISQGDTLYVLTGVNMRTESNTDCEIIDVIPGGEEITYLGEMEHGFYKVEYNGKVGYVYSDYVQK